MVIKIHGFDIAETSYRGYVLSLPWIIDPIAHNPISARVCAFGKITWVKKFAAARSHFRRRGSLCSACRPPGLTRRQKNLHAL